MPIQADGKSKTKQLRRRAEPRVAKDVTPRALEDALWSRGAILRGFFNATQFFMAVFELEKENIICRMANPTMASFFGFSPEEMSGKTLRHLHLPEEKKHFWMEKFRESQRTGEKAEFEISFSFRGKEPWFSCSFSPIRIGEEASSLFSFAAVEITERKRFEEELKGAWDGAATREQRLQAIMDTIPVAVTIMEGPNGQLAYVNLRGKEFSEGGAVVGGSLLDQDTTLKLYRPNGNSFLPEALPVRRAFLKGERVNGEEITIEHPDGKRTYVLANANPLRNEAGGITGAVGAFQDVTRLKETEENLRMALKDVKRLNRDLEEGRKEVEKANQELESFNSAVAHDLRNPMVVIRNLLEKLMNRYADRVDERGKGYLQTIVSAGNGKETLQKLEGTRPDLVILDIAMPVMNGLEALAKIRETRDGEIPVILHTSHESYRKDPLSRSADASVLKSIDTGELKEKIKELIQRQNS